MGGRTTAEIAARLRSGTTIGDIDEAADRLAELDAARPDCPTCGGTKRKLTWSGDSIPCPDCVDGRVPFERLVAVFNRVFKFIGEERPQHGGEYGEGWRGCIDHLRSIR